jgi:hypothetical protein
LLTLVSIGFGLAFPGVDGLADAPASELDGDQVDESDGTTAKNKMDHKSAFLL